MNDERSDCGYWNHNTCAKNKIKRVWTMNDPIVDTETIRLAPDTSRASIWTMNDPIVDTETVSAG